MSGRLGIVRRVLKPQLVRLGAFLDPAQIHMDKDVDDEQPTCVDCPAPASEQVLTGWLTTPGSTVVQALFSWLCDECAEHRRNRVHRDPMAPSSFRRSNRPVDEL